MSVVEQSPDLLKTIADLERRIGVMERMAPAFTRVVDSSNNLRLLEGQLDGITGQLYGNSYTYPTGTYGFTIMDASGNIIADSLGASQSGKLLASNPAGTGGFGSLPALSFSTSFQGFPGTNLTFVLSRPTNVMILSNAIFYPSGGTASYMFLKLAILGTSQVSYTGTATNGAGVMNANPYISAKLTAGSYTVQFQGALDAGATTTMNMKDGRIDVYSMGG